MKRKIKTLTKSVANNTFQAKVQNYEVIEDNSVIKKALEDHKIGEKEKSLLAAELEKPPSQRNKALLNKYRAKVNETLDGWPDISTAKYKVTAIAPDDSKIPMIERPQPWYAKVSFTSNGSDFEYKFPIHLFATREGKKIYKIDNEEVYVDANSDIIYDLSSAYGYYEVLKDYIRGDLDKVEAYKKGDYYEFQFPGFLVTATRKEGEKKPQAGRPKGKKLEEDPVPESTPTPTPEPTPASVEDPAPVTTTSTTGQNFEIVPFDSLEATEGFDKTVYKSIEDIRNDGSVFIGPDVTPIPSENCVVDSVFGAGKKVSARWIVFREIAKIGDRRVMRCDLILGTFGLNRWWQLGPVDRGQLTAAPRKNEDFTKALGEINGKKSREWYGPTA